MSGATLGGSNLQADSGKGSSDGLLRCCVRKPCRSNNPAERQREHSNRARQTREDARRERLSRRQCHPPERRRRQIEHNQLKQARVHSPNSRVSSAAEPNVDVRIQSKKGIREFCVKLTQKTEATSNNRRFPSRIRNSARHRPLNPLVGGIEFASCRNRRGSRAD